MKRILQISLAALLLTTIVLPASAENSGDQPASTVCTVRADSVSGKTGETVTVPVIIENNPGFTNFGIALDYDRKQLELVSIQLADEQQTELVGNCAETNLSWSPEKDVHEEQKELYDKDLTYGYVVCASAEAVKEDGRLFTATFRIAEGFHEEAAVTPIVNYIRVYDNQAMLFQELTCTTLAGRIVHEEDTVSGDVDGDGIVSAQELIQVVRVYRGNGQNESVIQTADVNGNGIIDAAELIRVIRSYRGG